MTPDEIAASVKAWDAGDHIIIIAQGGEWPTNAHCELCGRAVVALAESVEKCKAPEWHLICIKCVGLHITSRGHVVKFKGRYRDSEGARRVLP